MSITQSVALFIRKAFQSFLSPESAAEMERESKRWILKCPNCNFERSVWDVGGVRWKAASVNKKVRANCVNCGKNSWHEVYYKENAA